MVITGGEVIVPAGGTSQATSPEAAPPQREESSDLRGLLNNWDAMLDARYDILFKDDYALKALLTAIVAALDGPASEGEQAT